MTKFEKLLLTLLGLMSCWLVDNYSKTGAEDYLKMLLKITEDVDRS